MNNKGQTTIFFTLIICVLFLFTLTAIEVGRINMGKTKARSVAHGVSSAIMADYNSELFERYHLLFMDPTYGTGSIAVTEEKIIDYLEQSLNEGKTIYQYKIEDVFISDEKNILDDNMKQVKEQIMDYERTAGLVSGAKELAQKLREKEIDVESAARETETNGVALDVSSDTENNSEVEVEDPRDTLVNALQFGVLDLICPQNSYTKENYNIENAPSEVHEDSTRQEKDIGFEDIAFLKQVLFQSAKEEQWKGLEERAAFTDYVSDHFTDGVNSADNKIRCEIEYILIGKENDYENMEAVVNDIIWLRMPINYAYLLTDTQKKSEALTLATGICIATHTEPLIEVVKYLLLGCWAYGESVCEMKTLLTGGKIECVKTHVNWITDLQAPVTGSLTKEIQNGLSYSDYLMMLLATKKGPQLDLCCARMLDVIQINVSQNYQGFQIKNCVGGMTIQGKLTVNSLFVDSKDKTAYEYFFTDSFSYSQREE